MIKGKKIEFCNAVIWGGDPMRKFAGGMNITGSTIESVWDMRRDVCGDLNTVNLKGMHVIPGFVDSHRHFCASAMMAVSGNAALWKSKRDALDAIEEECDASVQSNKWVYFSKMDDTRWKNPSLPSLREIDAAAKGFPVLVTDRTFHKGIMSSEAFRRTGLRRENLRHPGDITVRPAGSLTGVVWEEALLAAFCAMFRDNADNMGASEKEKMLTNLADRCLRMGVTHVHDPGLPSDMQRMLKDFQANTPLKLSWSVTAHDSIYMPPNAEDEAGAVLSAHAPKSVKLFLDGAERTAGSISIAAGMIAAFKTNMECLTGLSLRPLRQFYSHKLTVKKGRFCMPYLRFDDMDELIRIARVFSDRGYRLKIHALGNIAVRQASDLIRKVRPSEGATIEHMIAMDDRGLDDFAQCGAFASIQPGFIPYYADFIARLGAYPSLTTFPLKSLIGRGVRVCVNTDDPCGGSDDPLFVIRRAVDRQRSDGRTFHPLEAITQLQAMTAATIDSGRSLGMVSNGLSRGEPATFCIVDGDPFDEKSRVVQTWIDGQKAWSLPEKAETHAV